MRGRDIKRYATRWSQLWLIATLPSWEIDIEAYPAIQRYLLSYGKDRLAQSGETLADGAKSRKKTPHQWFELQDTCAYYKQFECEKIIWGNLSVRPRFAMDIDSNFVSAPTNLLVAKNHIKYIVGVLNSPLCHWIMAHLAYSREQGYMEYKKTFVKRIPIPEVTQKNYTLIVRIESLVDRIIHAKKLNSDTTKLEKQVDALVYKIYKLTKAEVAIMTKTLQCQFPNQ